MGLNDNRLGPRLGPSDADLDQMVENLAKSVRAKPSVHVRYATGGPNTIGIYLNNDLFLVDIVRFVEFVEQVGERVPQ